jgi:hypothetical protein
LEIVVTRETYVFAGNNRKASRGRKREKEHEEVRRLGEYISGI